MASSACFTRPDDNVGRLLAPPDEFHGGWMTPGLVGSLKRELAAKTGSTGSAKGRPRVDQGSLAATHVSVLVRLLRKATILSISASLRLRGCSTGLRLGSGLPPLAM